MLEVVLTVRDERGRPIDAAELGVDELVEVIRARPPSPGPDGPTERDLDLAVFGPAMLSLEVVELLSRQVAALRVACVAAVADETPGGSATDRVLDEVSCALVVSRRSAQHTRATAELLRHQPEVWAALCRGELDLTRARILADALFEVPRTDPDGVPREDFESECSALLADGLAYAQEHTARRLELLLQRRLLALGCGERPRRRSRGLAERGVWVGHRGDGTADLVARLASEDAERVYSVIRSCALADRNGDPTHDLADTREPLDIWLAAAFVDLVLDPRAGDSRAGAGADTARRLRRREGGTADQRRHRHHGDDPGRLVGRAHRLPRCHQRVRCDPCRRGPTTGRRRCALATCPDLSHHGCRARRRDAVVPASGGPRPARSTARRHLPVPRLRRSSDGVRPRPPRSVSPRSDFLGEPPRAVPTPPRPQARGRVASRGHLGRRAALDQPPGRIRALPPGRQPRPRRLSPGSPRHADPTPIADHLVNVRPPA